VGALPGFNVTPVELQATAVLLNQIGDEVRSELSRLGADADGLLEGGWRGPAAVTFGRGWQQWSAGATEVLDALEAMAHLLGVSGAGYGSADADSARALSRVGQP